MSSPAASQFRDTLKAYMAEQGMTGQRGLRKRLRVGLTVVNGWLNGRLPEKKHWPALIREGVISEPELISMTEAYKEWRRETAVPNAEKLTTSLKRAADRLRKKLLKEGRTEAEAAWLIRATVEDVLKDSSRIEGCHEPTERSTA